MVLKLHSLVVTKTTNYVPTITFTHKHDISSKLQLGVVLESFTLVSFCYCKKKKKKI